MTEKVIKGEQKKQQRKFTILCDREGGYIHSHNLIFILLA